ncbi:NAD-dependent epimerase/dehydratase family protein [Kiritimatiellaeota bacterium B1221]|nr:NAD-dependent epimerase/dehydratase family protein [Kiritimatiellaeota bacterium B1221]
MKQIDKAAPVMITGATGYVAGWIVKKLLDEGFTVHAPVRDLENPDKVKYLNQLAEAAPGTIKYFKADLLDEGSYTEAMQGCEWVFHTASPFTIEVRDPQKELVDPAKLGTLNILNQANQISSVKRVVLTSSCAAIYGDNADLKETPSGIFTEAMWNHSSSLTHQPYSYSKRVAEMEAWEVADKQDRWDLITINPSLVIGPGIHPFASSESFNIVKQFGDGRMKAGAPRLGLGAVDVRDVADAHIQAAFSPEAEGRYIVSAHNTDLLELGRSLLDKYGNDYPLPRKALPKWLVWLVGPLVNKTLTRKVIKLNIDLPWKADNSKGINALGLSYRPLKTSMEEMFQQLIDHNLITRAQ